MRFHRGYALLTLALFAIEVLIALFVRDRFVRPYLGDTLAVILVYAGLRAVFSIKVTTTALTAFAIACLIEIGQAIHFLDLLGLSHIRVARILFGTNFAWADILAYAAGAAIALLAERLLNRGKFSYIPQSDAAGSSR